MTCHCGRIDLDDLLDWATSIEDGTRHTLTECGRPMPPPPPVPLVPDVVPVRCQTCGEKVCADDTAEPETIDAAQDNHARYCHGITRCTCGAWALRNHACGDCARMVREAYVRGVA